MYSTNVPVPNANLSEYIVEQKFQNLQYLFVAKK